MTEQTLPPIVDDRNDIRRRDRMIEVNRHAGVREFVRRRAGMVHAMDGGLWLHRHVWKGRPMVHMVSTDRERLLAYGRLLGMPAHRLQYKPLKDPRTEIRREAWHWDLAGPVLPPHDDTLITNDEVA